MNKKKVLIIGAGPAGLTSGYEISKSNNFKVTIIEISSHVGGMARSFKLFDRIVDVGPHRYFSIDERVNKIWHEVIEGDFKIVNRLTRIYYNNKFFDYPLKPLNALFNFGIINSFIALFSYVKYLFFPHKDDSSFSRWVTNRFGYKLYKIFFKSYTEKLWGISPDKLSSEFAKQRIKNFSLGQAILEFFYKRNKHKTLVDQFNYPVKGNGYIYEKMSKKYLNNNGKIYFNKSLKSIKYNDNKYDVVYNNGLNETFDYLVSSMPIDSFLKIFKNFNFNQLNFNLKFRNTILVYSNIKKNNLFNDQWLYMNDEKIKSGRITNFNNWVPEIINKKKGTVLVNEYWSNKNEYLWGLSDESLIDICINDLLLCDFGLKRSDISECKVVKVPKCYPIYSDGYLKEINEIAKKLSKYDNLNLIGRSGSFKYNNQDHSILMGYLCAKNIVKGEKNSLWDINNDDVYQESMKIE